jgi:hypothetical protein
MQRFAMVAGMILLLAVGLIAYSSLPVDAQVPSNQVKWEYKAVTFYAVEDDLNAHTKQLNELGSAGWEYVGLIMTPYDSNGQYGTKSVVAFRRAN